MGGKKRKSPRSLIARIFQIKNWKLIILLVLSVFLAATLLRLDHIKMTHLRDEVLTLDAKEDVKPEELLASINQLHDFIVKHIVLENVTENGVERLAFSTGRIVLANSYYRKANEVLANAQREADQYTTSPNGNIYRKVADVCDAHGKANGWRYPDPRYISCWQNELAKYPSDNELKSNITAEMPSAELYEYEFASPYWYPCASGWVILFCVALLFMIIIRIFIWFIYKMLIFTLNHRK